MLPGAGRGAEFALDLGTSEVRLASSQGVLRRVPSVVAMRHGRDGRTPAAIGDKARSMLGRAPAHMKVVMPIRDGLVKDFEVAEHLIRPLLREHTGRSLRRPTVLVAISKGMSEANQRAVMDCVRASGAGRVELVSTTLAAAVGADLPVFDPVANFVADIGGGRTRASLFSLGGAVVDRSVELGGATIDAALATWARTAHGVLLSLTSAEQLKLAYSDGSVLHVRGRDLKTGAPRDLRPEPAEVTAVLAPVVQRIVSVLTELLRSSPPELCADLLDRGVILAGGVAKFELLTQAIRDGTGLPALPVPDPAECVARGLVRLLDDSALYSQSVNR